MADQRTQLTTRIILNSVFPVMKTAVADSPKLNKSFSNVNARVKFLARDDGEEMGATLVFEDGVLTIEQGTAGPADLIFSFSNLTKFNDFMCGKTVLPGIKGILKVSLLIKVVRLLLTMKLLMPDARPTDPDQKRLKVKLVIHMINAALSQYNKGGDPDMAAWTGKQPERIYQMSVDGEPDLAAYLRIKAGKSKAGKGIFKRRRPFVHIRFADIDSALPVLLNDLEFVEAVGKGFVRVEGSPEYGANLNDFMQRIQSLLV